MRRLTDDETHRFRRNPAYAEKAFVDLNQAENLCMSVIYKKEEINHVSEM